MTPTFSSDGAGRLNWNFRVDENNVPISLTFKDSAGVAYSFIYDDFQVKFRRYKGDKKTALLMGFGSGLTLEGNVLTIDLNYVRAHLRPGEYYWQLYKNDYGRVWLDGTATGYYGELPVIDSTGTTTLNDGEMNVTVTIREATPNIIQSGGSGGGAWGEIEGTITNQTDLVAYVAARLSELVDSSPAALDTLNELAAALGDDANFATTVTNALASKLAHTNSAVALTDGASITLTATKHTLTTDESAITFSISYAGDDITIEATVGVTTATYTFPAGSLCVSEGIETGGNTLAINGAVDDVYIIAIKKIGSVYYVVSKNFGQ